MNNKEWATLKEKWPKWNNIQRRLFTYWYFYPKLFMFRELAKKYLSKDIAIDDGGIFNLSYGEGIDKCTTDHDMQDLVSFISYELKHLKT